MTSPNGLFIASVLTLTIFGFYGAAGWLGPPALASRPTVAAYAAMQADCAGHTDNRPGCPGDPAGWFCTHEGRGGAHRCECKTICGTGEDGEQTISESGVCKRYCKKDRCDCDPEPECKP